MATVTAPRTHGDTVEDVLIQLDHDFAAVYGPDMAVWSKGVRGEYLETLRSHRTADREAHPLHPRRASAGRRRRHQRQLGYRVHSVIPGAVTVLLTPVWTDTHGPMERVYVVTARDADGRHLKLPRGGSRRLASLMQGAFPAANWDRPQTWRTGTNRLTGWQQRQATR